MAGSRYDLVQKSLWQWLGPAYRGLDADLDAVETTLAAGGGSGGAPLYYVGPTGRDLRLWPGDTAADKLRAAFTEIAGTSGAKPAVVVPPGTTIDVGNNPIVIPAGASLVGSTLGVETEFGNACPVDVRATSGAVNAATGGKPIFKTAPRGTNENGAKGWSFRGIRFRGTGTEDLIAQNPGDSSGSIVVYATFDNVSVSEMNTVYWGPLLGFTWSGTTYLNNFGMGPILWCGGSDNQLFTDGAFLEMGTLKPYSTRAQWASMIRCDYLKNTVFGPLYVTGSPTTPFRVDGGTGTHGLNFTDVVVEGRPVPGSGPDYLWCAGSLMRLTGGRTHWRGREWGWAMRDPAATTYAPTGFITVTGGEHVIDGGTFTPFPAANYAGGVVPPFARVTGGILRVRNITAGGNVPAGTRPVVSTTNAAFVDADASVTVTVSP